ncbi:hypothetical protein [Psychrobacillus sp. FSL K6-1464]|uniref:hypothetical protein n=1 Tax=Psychrobacillus sp. FSL K6-1464 TaxID=2921545 RepID=UPI0030F813B3
MKNVIIFNIIFCLLVIFISDEPVKDEHREKLGEFARMLTDHLALAHCEVIIKDVSRKP